jgi:hypothetical protein
VSEEELERAREREAEAVERFREAETRADETLQEAEELDPGAEPPGEESGQSASDR